MKLAVVGTGYVGLVAGACFADCGHEVICLDVDREKIGRLKGGEIPIYEPGLEELVRRNMEEGRLEFRTDLPGAVNQSEIIFIAVGTPSKEDGSADMKHVLNVATQVGNAMQDSKIVAIKSTVPPGGAASVCSALSSATTHRFAVVSNPEFLKEGTAVDDFTRPDRVVLGGEDLQALDVMKDLYSPFVRTGKPIILMDNVSAEMTKYASNAMLATRISFMNEIANLCERTGADVDRVRECVGMDTRIGPHFLFPGAGYGGSCFPKDLQALIRMGRRYDYPMKILEAVESVNHDQKKILFKKIRHHFSADLKDRKFAVWGLAFKPKTDDMRQAPSIVLIESLLAEGCRVSVYDPEAMATAREIFGSAIDYASTNYEACDDADALVIVTEWNEFRRPDFERLRKLLKSPILFDGRNLYDPAKVKGFGYTYYSIGRPAVGASGKGSKPV